MRNSPVSQALRAIRAAVGRLQAGIERRRRAGATYAALHELDARALRDIGLDRSEIPSVVAEIYAAVRPNTRIRALRSPTPTRCLR